MLENNLSNNIRFSFVYTLLKCLTVENKHFSFTNQIPAKKIKDYRTTIEKSLQDYSNKTIKELEQSKNCYPLLEKTNIVKVFQNAGYPRKWIEQNIQDTDIYKFKITKQIRMFGIVERNVVYILLYDIWHQINKDKKKNFPIPDNLICTWCLKSCDKSNKKLDTF